jgi:hypothetical protein
MSKLSDRFRIKQASLRGRDFMAGRIEYWAEEKLRGEVQYLIL